MRHDQCTLSTDNRSTNLHYSVVLHYGVVLHHCSFQQTVLDKFQQNFTQHSLSLQQVNIVILTVNIKLRYRNFLLNTFPSVYLFTSANSHICNNEIYQNIGNLFQDLQNSRRHRATSIESMQQTVTTNSLYHHKPTTIDDPTQKISNVQLYIYVRTTLSTNSSSTATVVISCTVSICICLNS